MIKIEIIEPKVWVSEYSEKAHLIAFGKSKPKEWDRIDFAIIMADSETAQIVGYLTCREFDHETLYLQYGGSMPGSKGTPKTLEGFNAAMLWAATVYKRVTCLVENDNYPMLNLAMKAGFKITGLRGYMGNVLLENTKEFS